MKISVQKKSVLLSGLIATALVLTGCGGGSDSSSTDPVDTISSRGVITGFGSMYVTGVKYDTDDAEFDVDDDKTSTQSALRVGQFVIVTGSIDANGKTGHASHISYENELQGPIQNKTPDPADSTGETGTMEVLGRLVTVDADTRIDDGLTFVDLADNNFVEISGFNTDTGITATYIELQSDSEVEMVGEIAMLDVVPGTFEIYGFTIAYDGNTELEDDITLADGLYVEVKGELDPLDDTRLIAEKIEAEDDGKGDDMDEEELQGIVSKYDSDTKIFYLGLVKVDATDAELKPASLDLGSAPAPEVEVEGHWFNGVLIADEIEQKGRKIKINAVTTAADPDAGTVTFNFNGTDVVVRVNQQTEMEDEAGGTPLDPFTPADLSQTGGDFIEMEAFSDGSGDINAVELKRKDLDEVKIQAPVEGSDEATQMVTLLGISFDLSAAAYKDDDGMIISIMDFYAAAVEGVFIKLKDTDNNLVIDSAELEDQDDRGLYCLYTSGTDLSILRIVTNAKHTENFAPGRSTNSTTYALPIAIYASNYHLIPVMWAQIWHTISPDSRRS